MLAPVSNLATTALGPTNVSVKSSELEGEVTGRGEVMFSGMKVDVGNYNDVEWVVDRTAGGHLEGWGWWRRYRWAGKNGRTHLWCLWGGDFPNISFGRESRL